MNETPEYVARRDELRSLSQSRVRVGLSLFPTVDEVAECARNLNMTQLEAHVYLMHEGERLLEIKERDEKDEKKARAEKARSSSERV